MANPARYKKIGSFPTQKATARFRGRNYTAWFCSEIPISDGPWKLNGLPGLILEAYDDTGEVKFIFKDIEIPYKGGTSINPPITGLEVSFEDYKKADETEFIKMKKKTLAQQSGRGGVMTITRNPPNLLEKEYER
ncbi:MAG: GLPGLI family protein [Siphonobacter sp.]